MGGNAHHGGQPQARLVHFCTAKARGLIGGIGLNFALCVKPVQAVHDLLARIGPACILEKRLTVQRGL